jgi:NDP-sugar pyrophosphorylase family protein
MTQGVIVAAGHGTRLYPLTDVIAKVMMPIGAENKPMGQLIIEQCMLHGINEFVFCLNAQTGKQVYNYFGDGSRFGVKIEYSYSSEPQGTAGELKLAYERGLIKLPTLIMYGDTLCTTDLSLLMTYEYPATVVVNDLVRMPYGFVVDREGDAIKIVEKPTLSQMVETDCKQGVGAIMSIYYITDEEFFSRFCRKGIDVSGDILPWMMDLSSVGVFHDKNPFVDVGNWKSYGEAKQWD